MELLLELPEYWEMSHPAMAGDCQYVLFVLYSPWVGLLLVVVE